MVVYLSKDGTYLINDVDRGRKRFSHNIYFTLDNWWYDFKMKNMREPTFSEMQQVCARRGIAGVVEGKPATFPDKSMKGIYSRLCGSPDPIIRKCLGTSGKCAPLHSYRTQRIFYMSAEVDEATKRCIKNALKEKKVLDALHPKGGTQNGS